MNVMLYGEVGSYAYGLNLPQSDHDFVELFANEPAYYLGLGEGSKSHNHKNQETGVEMTRYELRHWAATAVKGNPEFLQVLWLNHDYVTEGGGVLLDNRNLFLSKAVLQPYTGCAYRHMQDAKEGKNPGKNFMSAMRYLRQCTEVLLFQELNVSRVGIDREELLDMRLNPPDVKGMEELWNWQVAMLYRAHDTSTLPLKPDLAKVSQVVQNALTLELQKKIFGGCPLPQHLL